MHIRYGFNIEIDVSQPMTLLTALDVEQARRGDIVHEQPLKTGSVTGVECYTDEFGNLCRRIQANPGTVSLSLEGVIQDSGLPDPVVPDAEQIDVANLPVETLPKSFHHEPCRVLWRRCLAVAAPLRQVETEKMCCRRNGKVRLHRRPRELRPDPAPILRSQKVLLREPSTKCG